ncbi:MAG TPA: murein L,D-transpeptidase family protein, partial [Hyphomicrobiales bacterium]|nr:murein L,D-transpeptidase family protein [Hyphomicrobiales bacterium]
MDVRRLASALLAMSAALWLAGCQQPDTGYNAKAEAPIPAETMSLMSTKGMKAQDPILIRIFKEESQLEVWKKRESDGRYALLKSYPICRWSGTLGPKVKTGDHQSPEGFYPITPAQMNPRSHYYLSFNTGFPNTFDRAHGRTGSDLMVHGDCLSAGCYAMTDGQMAEIYALAREAFRGGQKEFQVEAFPFHMTAENMARRRNDKNMAFWRDLKVGYDHFAVTREEPKVAVCGGRYVFDAVAREGERFEPDAPCPAYTVAPAIASAVAAKERADAQQFASLVKEGTPVAAAYVPQNGRLRRTLDEPIRVAMDPPVPPADAGAAVAAAFAPAKPAAAEPARATAVLARNAVPMPAPSPTPHLAFAAA